MAEKDVADIRVKFITPEGEEIRVLAKTGETGLELAHHHDVELEGFCAVTLCSKSLGYLPPRRLRGISCLLHMSCHC